MGLRERHRISGAGGVRCTLFRCGTLSPGAHRPCPSLPAVYREWPRRAVTETSARLASPPRPVRDARQDRQGGWQADKPVLNARCTQQKYLDKIGEPGTASDARPDHRNRKPASEISTLHCTRYAAAPLRAFQHPPVSTVGRPADAADARRPIFERKSPGQARPRPAAVR